MLVDVARYVSHLPVLLAGTLAVSPCAICVAQSANGVSSKSAAPALLQAERKVKLSFAVDADVALRAVATRKERVHLARVDRFTPDAPLAAGARPMHAGALTWWISSAGTWLTDRTGGTSLFASALTSRAIRPRAILDDSAHASVWLYGEGLYRYRIASGELHGFKPVSHSMGVIRKAVVSAAGVWLATEQGVFLFDDVSEALRTVPQAGSAAFINAAAMGQGVWLASDEPRLVNIRASNGVRATLAVSDRFALGTAAEMYSAGDTLWMLLTEGGGHRIAYLDRQRKELALLGGSYFSLRQDGDRLVAGAHGRELVIDPQTRTAATRVASTAAARAGEISFLGSSYSVKDPSETVEHRPFDLSRGWSEREILGTVR